MYLFYIDESVSDDVFLVGGVFLPSNKYRKYRDTIKKFIEKQDELDEEKTIHADYIWNGRKLYDGYSMERRAKITKKIASFLGESNLTRFYSAYQYIDKSKNQVEIYKKLLGKVVEKAASYVSKNGGTSHKQLLLIFDKRSDKNKIHNEAFNIQSEIATKYQSSCCFVDCGYEGIMKYSRLLQSADFVAFWTRQIIEKQKNQTLFNKKDDSRKIDLIENIEETWADKLTRKQIKNGQ